jgi:predicted nuclease with TOPRIM domain
MEGIKKKLTTLKGDLGNAQDRIAELEKEKRELEDQIDAVSCPLL